MRIYIAGPMRGLPGWNFEAFKAARERWQQAGHHPYCPATMAEAMGYGYGHEAEPSSAAGQVHLRHVMMSDIACLFAAEAIALLPGWETSRGATVELALAQFLGLPVYCGVTMERINPVLKPWSVAEPLRRSALRDGAVGAGHSY